MMETGERVGENKLRVSLDFPDAETRDGFERSFLAWLDRYEQAEVAHRRLAALAQQACGDEDTAGYWGKVCVAFRSADGDDIESYCYYRDLVSWL